MALGSVVCWFGRLVTRKNYQRFRFVANIVQIDQDTIDLKALNAVLAPKNIQAFANNAKDASYWEVCSHSSCFWDRC